MGVAEKADDLVNAKVYFLIPAGDLADARSALA